MSAKRKLKKAKGLPFKYMLRLYGSQVLARVGRALGIGWEALGLRLGREVMIPQVRRAGGVRTSNVAPRPLDIIFTSLVGANQRLMTVDVVLARALQIRGHKVRFVLCDQALPACVVREERTIEEWAQRCAICYEFGHRFLEAAGHDVLTTSQLVEGMEACRNWQEYVESALLKHFRVGVLSDDPIVKERRCRYQQAALVSEKLGKKLSQMRPDRVIMTHGIYCMWGPVRETLLRGGIPLVTTAEGKKKDTMKFNWSTSADWWDVSGEWERVKDVQLTAEQEKSIDDYLTSRRTHSLDARVYNFGDEETLAETWRRLDLAPDKQTFLLFTNVLWDAASAQREIAFKNPIEWVMETIAWFAEHRQKQLVVKIHPAEVVIGTNQPFASLIKARFPELPRNVRVVEPHEEVNSWSIMKVADLGLVHTSTVGMELPLEGIPCAVVSRTHFRGRGFTIDVDSAEEYFHLIESWDGGDIDREQLKVSAKRYAYLLFERYQLPFPFTYEPRVNDVRALRNFSDEEIAADPTMKLFVHALENREDFLIPCALSARPGV